MTLRWTKRLFLFLIVVTIVWIFLSLVSVCRGEEFYTKIYEPKNSEKYTIPEITLFIVPDEVEWSWLCLRWFPKEPYKSICGVHVTFTDVKNTKHKLYVVYLPKRNDMIRTETLGHEVLHVVEKTNPLFRKRGYNVDEYTYISPLECGYGN